MKLAVDVIADAIHWADYDRGANSLAEDIVDALESAGFKIVHVEDEEADLVRRCAEARSTRKSD